MKVLFVCSGNSKFGISPIVKSQAISLTKNKIIIDFFAIKGKGLKGYLKNLIKLRKYLSDNKYDVIHAHFSLSAIVASLSGAKPIIVSLMGSDIQANSVFRFVIRFFYKHIWDVTIVKSEKMKMDTGFCNSFVIPNGVNLNDFKFIDKIKAIETVNFNVNKKNIIWVSDPKRYEKNFQLADNAIGILNDENIMLNVVTGIAHDDIANYMYAADILLLTSFWEGSPNVVKEAMACNLPVVSTNVGDVEWLFGDEPGYFPTSFEAEDVAEKIKLALEYKENHKNTNGRQRIVELGLDSESVARKIISIYSTLIDKKSKG